MGAPSPRLPLEAGQEGVVALKYSEASLNATNVREEYRHSAASSQSERGAQNPKNKSSFNAAARRALGDIRKALDELGLQPNDLVLVAVSGGADSLALAAETKRAAHRVGESTRKKGFGIRVGAVIIDHQMQFGSDDAATEAAAQCRTIGLDPVLVLKVEVGYQGGREAAARAARYAALEQAAADLGAKAVLLGHTLDDQAEQVLLGLARGSGARSLGGMPQQRTMSQHQGVFARPFLNVPRSTTEFLCEWHRLTPWQDPTNQQPIYLRNRIRNQVMPELKAAIGPGVPEALARTAEQLAEDADALDYYAEQLLASAARLDSAIFGHCVPLPQNDDNSSGAPAHKSKGSVPLPKDGDCPICHPARESQGPVALRVESLLEAPVAVRRRALRLAAINAGAPASDVNRTQVLAIDALVANWHGQSAHKLPGNIQVSRQYGMLVFEKTQPAKKPRLS